MLALGALTARGALAGGVVALGVVLLVLGPTRLLAAPGRWLQRLLGIALIAAGIILVVRLG